MIRSFWRGFADLASDIALNALATAVGVVAGGLVLYGLLRVMGA